MLYLENYLKVNNITGRYNMVITPYEVSDIPVSNRKGSGRTSSIFTDEVIDQLLNNRGKTFVIHYEDFIGDELNNIEKRRVAISAQANYAKKKYSNLNAAIRTQDESDGKRIYLYAFFT